MSQHSHKLLDVYPADPSALADDHVQELEQRRVRSALSRWRDIHGRRQNQVLQANLVYQTKRLVKSFRIWSTASGRIVTDGAVADNAHRFFLERTVLQCWKAAYEQRKRAAWAAERDTKQIKEVFSCKHLGAHERR